MRDLKRRGLWDEVMVMDLKHFDGSLRADRPRARRTCKALYATAFEVEPKWLVEAAARRQKWIDQAQSLNIYMAGASGKKLDETYKLAWLRGLKTTYYLRTHERDARREVDACKSSAAQRGVADGDARRRRRRVDGAALRQRQAQRRDARSDVEFCALDDSECEACQ